MNMPVTFYPSRTLTSVITTFTQCLLTALPFMLQAPASHAELGTIMSLGTGQGNSYTQGDYTEDLSSRVFTMGFDYDYQQGLFLAKGQSSTNNEFKQLDLIAGFGNKHIKIGTGFICLQTSVPQNPNNIFDTSGDITVDTGRRIDVSVTTIPLYLRLKPIITNNFALVIDGYYGLYSRGSITFPFFETRHGINTTVSSIPKKQGGAKGYSIAATWRLAHTTTAISIEFQHREATMVERTSRLNTDVFGLLGEVTTPEMTFRNSALLLKYVLVK